MLLIADTSPIISLLLIEKMDILEELFLAVNNPVKVQSSAKAPH